MIKEIGKLCKRQDPKLPRSLTEEQKHQAHSHPKVQQEIQHLEQCQDTLTQDLKARFGTIKGGDFTPEFKERNTIKDRIRYRKLQAEKEPFKDILQEVHDTADLNHMVSQLEGKSTFAEMLPPPNFVLDERQRLATTLFQDTTEASFAQIVEDLSTLCTRREDNTPGGYPSCKIQPLSQTLLNQQVTQGICARRTRQPPSIQLLSSPFQRPLWHVKQSCPNLLSCVSVALQECNPFNILNKLLERLSMK